MNGYDEDNERFIETYNYYDGRLDGVLYRDGMWFYWRLADDSELYPKTEDGRIYELWRATGPLTDEELQIPFDELPRFMHDVPIGTITEKMLAEYEEKSGD